MIYFLAFVAAIAGFLFGYDEGVIAVARASLDKDLPMSALVGGFMTAAVPLGALVAASVAGPITDRFGRRSVLMGAAALFAVGALMAASIDTVLLLVIARFVLGVAIGIAAVAAPLYIAECAPLESRGAMVSTYQLAITVGILVSYLTGVVIDDEAAKGMWRIMFGRDGWFVSSGRPMPGGASSACAGPPPTSTAKWPRWSARSTPSSTSPWDTARCWNPPCGPR
jgi:SP family galactose:H+ symporter-like MFS transporter